MTSKVQKWVDDVKQLSKIAKEEPQAAYCVFTKGLCYRWTFLLRTVQDVSHPFIP